MTFDKNTFSYAVSVPHAVDSLTVTPTAEHQTSRVKVNGVDVASGQASPAISLNPGHNEIKVEVTAGLENMGEKIRFADEDRIGAWAKDSVAVAVLLGIVKGMLDEAVDNTLVCTFNDLDDVERTLKENRGEVAALIVEPIQHNVGCVLPRPGFLEGLRELCTRHGVILIFDEVITGFRHHLGGYQKLAGVTPDLTTMGKAMANGFAIAAVAGRKDLMERFNTRPGGDVWFSGTYNGHAAAVAAAIATIEVMEIEPVHEHIFRLGERVRAGIREIADRLGVEAYVAGFGSVWTTYFMNREPVNYTDLMENDRRLYVAYREHLIRHGIYKPAMNLKRNHISYSHTDSDIDETLQCVEDVLTEMIKHRSGR